MNLSNLDYMTVARLKMSKKVGFNPVLLNDNSFDMFTQIDRAMIKSNQKQKETRVTQLLLNCLLTDDFVFDKIIHNAFDLKRQLEKHYGKDCSEFILENWI